MWFNERKTGPRVKRASDNHSSWRNFSKSFAFLSFKSALSKLLSPGLPFQSFFVNHNLLGTVCTIILWFKNSFLHMTDEEAEGQRGLVAVQKSHSQEMSEQASELISDGKTVVFNSLSDLNQTCHLSPDAFHHPVPPRLLVLTWLPLPILSELPSVFSPSHAYRAPSCSVGRSDLTRGFPFLTFFIHIHISISHQPSWAISLYLFLWLLTQSLALLNFFHIYYLYYYFSTLL